MCRETHVQENLAVQAARSSPSVMTAFFSAARALSAGLPDGPDPVAGAAISIVTSVSCLRTNSWTAIVHSWV